MYFNLLGNKKKIANQEDNGNLIVNVANQPDVNIDEVGLKGEIAESLPKGISHNQLIHADFTHEGISPENHFETTDPCILKSFVFTTDSRGSYPQIYIRDANGDLQLLRIPRSFVSTVTASYSPLNLNYLDGESDIFVNQKYDTSNNEYVMILKEPLYCPSGVQIRTVGSSSGESNVAFFGQVVFFS